MPGASWTAGVLVPLVLVESEFSPSMIQLYLDLKLVITVIICAHYNII